MSDAIPSVFIYEYPTMGGPPLGTYDLAGENLDDPEFRRVWCHCVGALAVSQDDGTLVAVGTVFRYRSAALGVSLDVLLCGEGETLCLHRDVVAATLFPTCGTEFRARYAEQPWVCLLDVLLWAQYESNLCLFVFADELARTFLSTEQQERVFRLGQGLCPAIERNRRQERQALRRAFTKALPDLLPGTSIARKKPGYGWKKGRADFFLSQQADLCPTQLLRQPVSQTCVETLREAIQAYHSPRGYVVAPARTWSWTTPWSLCPLGARTCARGRTWGRT